MQKVGICNKFLASITISTQYTQMEDSVTEFLQFQDLKKMVQFLTMAPKAYEEEDTCPRIPITQTKLLLIPSTNK